MADDQVISVFSQLGFVASLVIGFGLAVPLGSTDVIIDPLLLAIILSATSLGIVCPVLKDAGILDTRAGTFVVAACSVAEFGSIVALSMFFSPSGSTGLETVLALGVLAMLVGLIAFLGSRQGPWRQRVGAVLYRLQDRSSQLRVRIAMLLMITLLVVSEGLGFDAIPGSFLAGALLSAVTDPAREGEFGHVRHKLEGIGFVPIFFVPTGLSLPVVATQIGVEIGELKPINAASLVAAGMLSVLVFPAFALKLLDRAVPDAPRGTDPDERAVEGM